MKIALITVFYNSTANIEKTIQLVAAQTYKNIEYIVIDGNSKDNTVAIIKKHEAVITKWVSEPDKGLYDAMNKGIEMATGDIIGILNSDDTFYNNTVLSVGSVAVKNLEAYSIYQGNPALKVRDRIIS
ncbi:glycosyltransferase [Algoriphagus aquimarinus]|uniref:Glycosyltransferase n=1 Tax=Algoriphagus aquimarinus TaxID=237018 RepID=A0A5C7AYB5_9BACT|nr:glycosyltransferase [Algoriphagus aquimarinus]TXE11495.1 glycosyltransferase [Algoriphagus aquimarinus]